MKLTKSTYLLILLLIGLKFCRLSIFAPLFNGLANHAILMAFWLYIGYKKWGDFVVFKGYNKEKKIWFVLMIGMIMSYIPLYINIGQTPIYSTWLYRDILLTFIIIPILLSINISKDEILTASWRFSLFYGFAFLLSIIAPGQLAITRPENYELIKDEHNIGSLLLGFDYLTVPLYILLERYSSPMRESNDLYKIIYLYSIIFLNQNRSVLFVASVFTLFFLLKSRNKILKLLILVGLLIVCINPKYNPIGHLISETNDNLSDSDAHRNLAWTYYSEANIDNALHFFCGRGIESKHYGNGMEDMAELSRSGIRPSDVGYWGFMYVYGIIPILVFLYSVFIVLKNKIYSYSTKMLGTHITVGGFTISYFSGYEHGLWFSIFFVLMTLDRNK